ncbi:MAG TPA: SusE domain-containing protein, partial [Phnomibacter sp.]|nr:SusE domain-containing protein [Phnomibacter sp.]
MKSLHKLLLAVIVGLVAIAGCKKEPALLNYRTGIDPSFGISYHVPNPNPEDSNKYVIFFQWNNPEMQTDFKNVKFVTEIDFVGNNFANPLVTTVVGAFADSVQAKVLNKFLLDRGVAFGAYANLQARMTASYLNNNDAKVSNVVPFQQRAYKIPPRVQLPFSGRLFIVGNATDGGWNNPVPVPTQELARLDETTWAGVFRLYGGAQYLLLPENGSWDNKYSVANTNAPGLNEGGDFGYNLPGNFPGPIADGLYKIFVDFQLGKFTVEPFTQQHGLPTQLVVVGGASPWAWNNSPDNPQRLTQLNSAEWQINSINLRA